MGERTYRGPKRVPPSPPKPGDRAAAFRGMAEETLRRKAAKARDAASAAEPEPPKVPPVKPPPRPIGPPSFERDIPQYVGEEPVKPPHLRGGDVVQLDDYFEKKELPTIPLFSTVEVRHTDGLGVFDARIVAIDGDNVFYLKPEDLSKMETDPVVRQKTSRAYAGELGRILSLKKLQETVAKGKATVTPRATAEPPQPRAERRSHPRKKLQRDQATG